MPKRNGPPPKPTKLKVLAGNPGKRPLNQQEPEPAVVEKAPPPDHLPEMAKEKWREIVTELCRLELVTVVDLAALEMTCLAYCRWRENEDWITKYGGTLVFRNEPTAAEKKEGKPGKIKYTQVAPQVTQAHQAFDRFHKMMAEFGLSPSARSRLTSVKKVVKDEDLEEFFGT